MSVAGGTPMRATPRRCTRGRALALLAWTAVAVATLGAGEAAAQPFPNRPVKIIVGQSAGGTPDTLARVLRDQLADYWQQTVVVENRPGAGGTIAADAVAKAPADGYTLLLGGPSNLATAVHDPALPYDPVGSFAPIGRVVRIPMVLIAGKDVPVKNIAELVAYARAHPGRLTYVSYGEGAISSLAVQLVMEATGVDLVEVRYRGLAQAMPDLLAGRVDVTLMDYVYIRPQLESGTFRVLGATGARRTTQAPEIPTVAEQGIPGYAVEAWYGLVAPAGVPKDVHASLVAAMDHIRRSAAMRERIAQLGYELYTDSPAEFAAAIRTEVARYTPILRRLHAGGDAKARGAAQ